MPCDEKFLKGILLGTRMAKFLGMSETEIRKMVTECIKAEIEYDKERGIE